MEIKDLTLVLKNKERYNYKGLISVEDLFDLSIEDLDVIYKDLMRTINESETQGLIKPNKDNEVYESNLAKLNVVKYVFSIKQEEIAANKSAQERAEKKQRILSIIADKQDENLKAMSIEELEKLLDAI